MFKEKTSRKNLYGMVLYSVLIALSAVSLSGVGWYYFAQETASEWVRHTIDVEARLFRLTAHLDDTETSSRGYLLTGDESYLELYFSGASSLEADLKQIGPQVASIAQQGQRLSTLKLLTAEKLQLLKRTIELEKAGKAEQALELIRSGAGKAKMDQIRDIIAQMVAEEERLLELRMYAQRQATIYLLVGVLLAFVTFGALAILGILKERRQKRGAITSRDDLALANEKIGQEIVQRGRVEHQLRQSQKIEAIGELTGGIAHDFNNILMVIMANVEALEEDGNLDAQAVKRLARITSSTQRAADLTRSLLAFARKQPLQPESTSLNDIVAGTGKMLSRTLGEQIEVQTILADNLWFAKIDRAQLESSIVNLCLNARDAMPNGGRLIIETKNTILDEDYAKSESEVVAGQYVMLAVSDTGTGISPEAMEHVFEPFFTTKDVGKGTGLGLSMVYGFIKQSKGHIKIYSEKSLGTTVRIYLPRSQGSAFAEEKALISVPRGTERILVVEDDIAVRDSVVLLLRSLGYVIGEADCAAAGLERLSKDSAYALLLTDVVMPGQMNGKAFADEAVRRCPGLAVLFMSGYTENAIIRNGQLDEGIRLLSKPFRKVDLARAVRGAMDDTHAAAAD